MKQVLTFFVIVVFFIKSYSQKKPNIVIFICDDLSQTDTGCYGNKDVHTPNIDKLASEGMRFTNAYAASPMCTPSRSVMFTGLYPFKNGCQMNHFSVNPGMKTMPEHLLSLGYRVVNAGKADIFPKPEFPFEYIGQEFGKYEPIEDRTDPKKETVHFIETHFKEQTDQPLCLVVAPWLPHVPWMPNQDFDPSSIKLPADLVDTRETRAALASYYQSISAADKMVGEVMEALDRSRQKDNTIFIFFADQGAQFPGAKWTVFDRGLRIPFIVRWPGKVSEGSISKALVSLADLTPTVIDLAGGKPEGFNGESIKNVLTGKKKEHHSFIFAETSMEPHFWYNYTPSRTIITSDGFQYIRNYYAGVRFVTHIDRVERNMYYFDSWIRKAEKDDQAAFLLNRYSFHPPEELYDLNKDRNEFENRVGDKNYESKRNTLRKILERELAHQGETEQGIRQGQLPVFYDHAYEVPQKKAVFQSSFNKKIWNPDTLFVTAYLDHIGQGGLICSYFDQFRLIAWNGKIGIEFRGNTTFYSEKLGKDGGNLRLKLTNQGEVQLWFDGNRIINEHIRGDFTKIRSGYVTCGHFRSETESLYEEKYKPFKGEIGHLRFTMNDLMATP